jgi:hypothetical protein
MNSIAYSHSPTRSVQDNMASLFASLKRKLQLRVKDSLIMRMVVGALAVRPRGGIANDVLALQKLSIGLHLEWLARDLHPWDRDLPEGSRAELFVQQCLEDADAAIPRLFHRLPTSSSQSVDIALAKIARASALAQWQEPRTVSSPLLVLFCLCSQRAPDSRLRCRRG